MASPALTTAVPTSVIRWEEPPPAQWHYARGERRSRSAHDQLADELRNRPGEWALVLETDSPGKASGMATHVRLGQVRCFTPSGDFDAVTRVADGKHRVYARYVGEEA